MLFIKMVHPVVGRIGGKYYSYKKIILDFISKNNINYFKLFIEKCLDITDENYNLYDEQTERE